jgi:DNA-binding NarL/FixJ family response regulator
MIGIAVLDDHPLALRGVESILAQASDVTILVSCTTIEELRSSLPVPGPDVILLDLYHDGAAACLGAVTEFAAVSRVLVMSASGRPEDVTAAIKAGACGYITKDTQAEMFLAAIYTAAGGGFWLSPRLADILYSQLAAQPGQRAATAAKPASAQQLSPREEEALALIARGLTHTQVATRMGISPATVDTYVERIRSKLQLGNKAELTRAAMERTITGRST